MRLGISTEEARMRDYEPLTAFLLDRSEPVVELSFAELDRLVVGGLPDSAHRHTAWWANSRYAHSHARHWLDAGRQAVPDFNGGRVRFPFGSERRGASGTLPQRVAFRPLVDEGDTRAEGQEITPDLRVEWARVGPILAEGGRPQFPSVRSVPGVYRFSLVVAGTDDATIYVGETDNLRQRMNGYRNPGPTQSTNVRIHHRILETISQGGSAEMAISTRAVLDGTELDLGLRSARRLVENALLVDLNVHGATVENL